MTALELHGLGHAYFGRTVLADISLSVDAGEIVALVGPSGCGKSTLVQIAAGLIDAREGRITRSYRRHAMVFQEPRLLPWATARQNIDYVLKLAGVRTKERGQRTIRPAERAHFELDDLEKYPGELSGGMRQRVAIARALAVEPDFIYFDEPFTALDVALKRRMQDLVIAASQQARFGALFITHDLLEALRIAHRIVVMHPVGLGLLADRSLAGSPGSRPDADTFATMQQLLHHDPAFAHIHDVDERRRA